MLFLIQFFSSNKSITIQTMKSQDKLKYPIGQFEYGKNYSLDEIRRHIKTIAKLPKELKKALKKLKSGDLEKSYRKGGWTVRQIVHHIADSHINAYVRMKLAVTELTPIIKPYEQANWAETEDSKTAPVKLSLKLLVPLHHRWVMFLETLSEEDLERGYFHPELQRIIPLPEAIAHYAWHCKHHLAHIRLVTTGKGEASSTLSAALPRATKAKPRGQQAKASAEKSAVSAVPSSTGERKKPGPKPKAKPAETTAPGRRKRRTKAEMEAARNTVNAVSGERKKPGPKPKAKVASGTPKLSREEVLAKARAARMANLAKKTAAARKAKPAAAPKRTRRSSAEVAAEKAAKAAAPKLSREEVLAKARAARMAKLAAAGKTPASKAKPASDAPKLSREEALAKARAARAAKSANKPAPKAKPAAKSAAKPAGETKRKGMSPERMAEIRAMRGKK